MILEKEKEQTTKGTHIHINSYMDQCTENNITSQQKELTGIWRGGWGIHVELHYYAMQKTTDRQLTFLVLIIALHSPPEEESDSGVRALGLGNRSSTSLSLRVTKRRECVRVCACVWCICEVFEYMDTRVGILSVRVWGTLVL